MQIQTTVQSPVTETFRVAQVRGLFDLPASRTSSESFSVQLPDANEPWQIGAIVGPSGAGKSTIARKAFGDQLVTDFDWPGDQAIVDGFPEAVSAKAITQTLTAVGFSSPPAWVRPYRVLSGGQRFRCDLARALMLDQPLVAFDEFTSVVDRAVAQVASACVAKAVRSGRSRCQKFVAVTCHYDVLDWLEPDWVLDLSTGELVRGSVQPRPTIECGVYRVARQTWQLFAKHHYLSATLNNAARCYAAFWQKQPVAFIATLPSMGFAGARRVTRLVVLPDFQGLGIGSRLLDAVAAIESRTHRMSIVTSHPALIRSLERNAQWRATDVNRGVGKQHRGMTKRTGRTIADAQNRVTVSFRYAAPAHAEQPMT